MQGQFVIWAAGACREVGPLQVLVGWEGASHPLPRPRASLWSWTLSVPAPPWVGPAFSAWAAGSLPETKATADDLQERCSRGSPSLSAPAGPAGASMEVALIEKGSCHLADDGAQLASH